MTTTGNDPAPGDHRVVRPAWMCAVDGLEWPCLAARTLLLDAFPDREALIQHVAALQAAAADELCVGGPSSLYRRFLSWTRLRGERCKVCGSSSHSVQPGIPRRLFPCNDLPTVIPPLHWPVRRGRAPTNQEVQP